MTRSTAPTAAARWQHGASQGWLSRTTGAPSCGFTLIEMVVVLVLLGILFSFAAPRISGLTPKYRLRSYARQLAGTLEKIRVAAIVRGRTTGIRYNLDASGDHPQSFQFLPPAPSDYPDQPLEERQTNLEFEPPTGVHIRGVILPGSRGGLITRGTVNIAFTAAGTTGSHIVVLEAPAEDGTPMVISIKYNTISGIIDYYNHEVEFQHYEA